MCWAFFGDQRNSLAIFRGFDGIWKFMGEIMARYSTWSTFDRPHKMYFFCWFAGDFPITTDYIKDKGYVSTPLIWRFPKSWGHPNSRMVYKFTMDNTKIIWVRIGGTPHFMKPP
jgi:hypothetical protein